LRVAVRDFFLDQSTLPDSRNVIGRGPVLGGHFLPVVERAGLEALQRNRVVAVIVGGEAVKVVEALIHRQVLAPVILDPLVANRATRLDLRHLVRPAAQRDFQVAFVEVPGRPPMFGQHWQLPDNQRQFTIIGVLELEQYGERVFGHHLIDVGIVAAIQRRAVLYQGVKAEHHVFGAHRVAVVECRLGAQVETHPAVVRVLFDLAGDQAVFGERLVQSLTHQGVVDQADVIGGHALADERVEAVEAAETGAAQDAALGRVRVHVVEVLVVGRVLGGLAVQGNGMLRGGVHGTGQPEQEQAASPRQ